MWRSWGENWRMCGGRVERCKLTVFGLHYKKIDFSYSRKLNSKEKMDANNFQPQRNIQNSNNNISLEVKHQHPIDAKIAFLKMGVKTEAKCLFKVHLKVNTA